MNNTQTDLLKYYKFVIMCGSCSRVFGTDLKRKLILCPICTGRKRMKKAGVAEKIFMKYETNGGNNDNGRGS